MKIPKLVFTEYKQDSIEGPRSPEFNVSGSDITKQKMAKSLEEFKKISDTDKFMDMYKSEKLLLKQRKELLKELKVQYQEFTEENYPELFL